MSVFYGYGGAHGYAYIFPKREHVNVGIGYVLPYFKEQRRRDALRSAAAVRRRPARARGMMDGESQRAPFHAVPDPDRRAAARGPPTAACCSPATPAASSTASPPRGSTTRWSRAISPPARSSRRAARRRGRAGRARGAPTCAPGGGRSAPSCATRCSSRRYLFHSAGADGSRRPRRADAGRSSRDMLVDYASGRLSYRAARRRLLWHFPRLLPRLAWLALRAAAGWPRRPRGDADPGRGIIRRRPTMADPGTTAPRRSRAGSAPTWSPPANCLREQIARDPEDQKLRAAYEGLLDLLDPSRLLVRKQRELAEAARQAATRRVRQRAPRRPDRRRGGM